MQDEFYYTLLHNREAQMRSVSSELLDKVIFT